MRSFSTYLTPKNYARYARERVFPSLRDKVSDFCRNLMGTDFPVHVRILKKLLDNDVSNAMLRELHTTDDVMDRIALQYDLKDKVCTIPFRNAYINGPAGDMLICCGSRVYEGKSTVGRVSECDIEELFNNEKAQAFREYLLKRTFNYCRSTCYDIYDLPSLDDVDVDRRGPYTGDDQLACQAPRYLELAHDPRCNLTCPQCRDGRIQLSDVDRENIRKTQAGILSFLERSGDQLEWLLLAGNGEVFASKLYMDILDSLDCEGIHKSLNIGIRTNGMLLDQDRWNGLSRLHNNIKWIEVSVDAATPETYAKVRRGGDWAVLDRNMRCVSKDMRAKGIAIRLNFVIQEANYREMGSFIDVAKTWNASEVYLQTLYSRGALRNEAFDRSNVLSPKHPGHSEFLDVLRNHNRLDDPVCVMTSYLKRVRAA